ncbi:hypothetical protein chiPu_0023533 [Chiloscyllium punctatum]|uniref:Uncharacterized protein n=1 Tax=Chiloscyllium punctatum TaxID=137246 RepID=A0A401TA90_CHIPU|nr:hypothetical protein [Chiloscyllium punctatum]
MSAQFPEFGGLGRTQGSCGAMLMTGTRVKGAWLGWGGDAAPGNGKAGWKRQNPSEPFLGSRSPVVEFPVTLSLLPLVAGHMKSPPATQRSYKRNQSLDSSLHCGPVISDTNGTRCRYPPLLLQPPGDIHNYLQKNKPTSVLWGTSEWLQPFSNGNEAL